MTRDFNIRDSNWDLSYPHYLAYSDILMEVADSFDLKLSSPINQVPTQYTDNSNNSNSVINLMFLWPNSVEINNHFILPEFQSLSNHAPLTVDIFISEEFIQDKWWTIIRNSKEEEKFDTELMSTMGNINTLDISSRESLKEIIQEYAKISDSIKYKISKT